MKLKQAYKASNRKTLVAFFFENYFLFYAPILVYINEMRILNVDKERKGDVDEWMQ